MLTSSMATEHLFTHRISDDDLLAELAKLAANERRATVRLIAALAEVDTRRLYLGQGCSSLFVYCTRVLRLSEHAAYCRIEAARAVRRFPVLLDLLESGELTLTTVCLVSPHLTNDNHATVLDQVRRRSKREVEELVATLRPREDVPSTLRKVPERSVPLLLTAPVAASSPIETSPTAAALVPTMPSARPAVLKPLAPARYKLQLTITRKTEEKIRRARDLMRHSVPSGDLAAILDRALDLLIHDLERQKFATVNHPRLEREPKISSRNIPAAVRRRVWRRDDGRCAFVGAAGRCGETGFLEFHHVRPFAVGGVATSENIELRCRAHNQYEADLFFATPPF